VRLEYETICDDGSARVTPCRVVFNNNEVVSQNDVDQTDERMLAPNEAIKEEETDVVNGAMLPEPLSSHT